MATEDEFLKDGQDSRSFRNTINTHLKALYDQNGDITNELYISPVNYGTQLPPNPKVGRVFFLLDEE